MFMQKPGDINSSLVKWPSSQGSFRDVLNVLTGAEGGKGPDA